jgi:hypothetical protein
MWCIDHFETRRVELDFSSSSQASREVTQITVGSVIFANAVELTSWGEARLQVLVCESCGIEQCEPGGWLCPRSAGDFILFVPAFSEIREGEDEQSEYAPPAYVGRVGIPVFARPAYALLRERCSELPPPEKLPAVSGIDLLHALQWEAPMRLLGRFPSVPKVRRDLVLAASDGEVDAVLASVSLSFKELSESAAVVLKPMGASDKAITLYLDGPATSEWAPIVVTSSGEWLVTPLPGIVAMPGL